MIGENFDERTVGWTKMDDGGDDFAPQTAKKRNHYFYPEAIKSATRFGNSDNNTCDLMNTTIDDFVAILKSEGFDIQNHEQYHISPSKIRAMKKKLGFELTKQHLEKTSEIECLGIDGKRSHCLIKYCGTEIIDKETVMAYPGEKYVDHYVPLSGKGIHLAAGVLPLIDLYKSRNSLNALLVDANPNNVGVHRGMIRYIEEDLNRAVQHFVCQLHWNELFFSHLFEDLLDGPANSQDVYTGRIGRIITEKGGFQLDSSEELIDHLKSKAIKGCVPIIDHWNPKEMNNDLHMFYEMCQAVMTGEISLKLLKRKMPKVTKNRWVNTATSILRLYIQERDPWDELGTHC